MDTEMIGLPIIPPQPASTELVRYTFEGVTNASGEFTVVFPTAFPQNPRVFASIIATGNSYTFSFTSRTTTGCTVRVQERLSVSVLGIGVALFASSPVQGVTVNIAAIQAP